MKKCMVGRVIAIFQKMPCFHPVHRRCYETRRWKEPLVRVPKMLWSSGFGILNKIRREIEIEIMRGRWDTKNNPRDYGIEEPYWGPSLVTSSALSAWKLAVHLVSFFNEKWTNHLMLISEYLEVSTEPGTVALVSFSSERYSRFR